MSSKSTIHRLTTWRGSRRSVLIGTLGAAATATGFSATAAQGGATPQASPASSGSRAHLLVADGNVNRIYVYSIPEFERTGQLDDIGLGVHGGSFLLEDGRLLFADTTNDEIVALSISEDGVPSITQRVSAALGGGVSWISASPTISHLVVGSLDEEGTSQFLNVVDLDSFENVALEFDMAEPEEIHGWLLGEPLHLYVAIGGQIDSYVLDDLLSGNTEPTSSVPVDLGSHGGATDARNRRILYTTGPGSGFDVLDVANGPAEFLKQIPWDVDGLAGGRNARPRLLRDGVHIFGVMTPGLEDKSRWAETTVSNHITNVDDLSAVRLSIDVGTLGYRWGLSDDYALWAGYNADGARAYLLDADPASDGFGTAIRTIDIALPSNAATPGQDYTGSEFYIMTSITPDGAYGFATISGDGLVQALDLEAGEVIADITVPSSLAGGGYTTVVQAGVTPVDLWAR